MLTTQERKNSYAKTKLFTEEKYIHLPESSLKSSIHAITTIVENMKNDEVLKKYLAHVNFPDLLRELIKNAKREKYQIKLREYVNSVLDAVQPILQSKSDSPTITNYDQMIHVKKSL